ncbi:ABC transporter substrate-binding protein [Trichloromonas sp.]|uniref:ABC transporter substrate-binding protein n=1 Tax=Trichloromonas sp. TaxID=3069249 RepID=UPI002A47AA64|nr:ABC transporter substrate binding protein [Trichloromonas sp.]
MKSDLFTSLLGNASARRQSCVLLLVLALILLFSNPASATQSLGVAILLSREIAPYIEMVEGLEEGLPGLHLQRFFLDERGIPYSLAGQSPFLEPRSFAAMVAVGPESLRYLAPRSRSTPLIYGMVLNPEAIFSGSPAARCGVDLNLPIAAQIKALRQELPNLKSLGVLFDPANNQDWFDQAVPLAEAQGLNLLALPVSRKSGGLDIPTGQKRPDAILFIPDRTIISRAFIQHVIKEAALRRIPVVGFNSFFLDSGAALAFVIDYRQVGRQVASQVTALLSGGGCRIESPEFSVQRNPQVWRSLGLPGGEGTP